MNVIVVGSGAREHALCRILHKSYLCEKVFCFPGNYGISQIAECKDISTKKDIVEAGIIAPIVGHVGDGNFHVALLIGPDDFKGDLKVAEGINSKLIQRALELGGTCTGEHGVGQGKMQYMIAEHGPALEIMKTLKQALDPDNIMNPGKIVAL